jgi:hypothetical protein
VSIGNLSRWSLGFQADYVASHPDEMDGWDEFSWWKLLGTPSRTDGELYRLICVEILDVFELSIVDVGAIESARTVTTEASLRAPTEELARKKRDLELIEQTFSRRGAYDAAHARLVAEIQALERATQPKTTPARPALSLALPLRRPEIQR